jgi:spore coat protein H
MKPVVEHPLIPFSLTDGWVAKMYAKRVDRPGFLPTFSNLNTRIAYNPELRGRLAELIQKGLAELFDPAVLHPRLDAMHALIAPHMEADPYLNLGPEGQPDPHGLAKFHEGLPFLKAYAERRARFIGSELERLQAAPQTLKLSAVNPSEGWVELHNPTEQMRSLGGLVLSADLRRTIPSLRHPGTSAVLPELQVPPRGTVRLTREMLGFTLPLEGELGLFDGRTVTGALDVLFYGALPPGSFYVRADGSSPWQSR